MNADCGFRNSSIQTQGQIPSNTRLELNLNLQIRLKRQLQPILVLQLTPALLRLHAERLIGIRATHRNLTTHRTRIGDGAIHGGAVGSDTLKHAHLLQVAVCVGLLEHLKGRRMHVLSVLLVFLEAGTAGTARGGARAGGLETGFASLLLLFVNGFLLGHGRALVWLGVRVVILVLVGHVGREARDHAMVVCGVWVVVAYEYPVKGGNEEIRSLGKGRGIGGGRWGVRELGSQSQDQRKKVPR